LVSISIAVRRINASVGFIINLRTWPVMLMNLQKNVSKLVFPLLAVALLVSGCGATGGVYRENPAIAPDAAQVVIFRPDTFFQGGIPYQVSVNGKVVAVLRNGGFAEIDAKPGVVLIEIRAVNWTQALFRNPSLRLSTAAKDRVFVRATPVTGHTVELEVISAVDATPELKSLRESQ
jgi:hypothetical protein